jgi:hypothetical protein
MTEPAPVDLIHLADAEGNRCIVRVTGGFQPGVLTGHDILRADVLASASFVDARLRGRAIGVVEGLGCRAGAGHGDHGVATLCDH